MGQRRAHAVAERDEREVRVLGFGDVGELFDVCRHVMPGGQTGPPKIVRTGRVAVSAQVDGVDDEALGSQESGEPVVSSAVLGDAVSDLHQCSWADPQGGSHFRTNIGA